MSVEGSECEECEEGIYQFNDYCGAYVCSDCNNHRGLARCFCGWRYNKQEPYPTEEELKSWG